MTQQTTPRKPATPAPCTCARCGIPLTHPIHTAFGTFGVECVKHLDTAKAALAAAGLTALAETGEIRLRAVRAADGTYHAPSGTQQLMVLADRAGVSLSPRFDVTSREIVLVASRASLRVLLNRTAGVAA